MNFDFSDDQRRLQEEIRRVLSEHSSSAHVRQVLNGEQLFSESAWQQLAQLGALGMALPEHLGGTGLGALELCLLAEESGRALAAVPLLSTVYLAAEIIRDAGSEAQQQKYLPAIASGAVTVCCQLTTQTDSIMPCEPLALSGHLLSGSVDALADAMSATHALLRVGDALVMTDLSQDGVVRTAQECVDPTRPLGHLQFKDVPCERVAASGAGIAERAVNGAAVLLAFEQVGGAEAALYAARDYVLERKTFGRTVGGYQAVKHNLADLFSAIEIARAHAWYGAWALSSNAPELPRAAAAARVATSEAYNRVAEESLHLHGGIGFTWEMDCHLHLRRARWLAQILGSRHSWRNRLAATLIEESV